MNQYILSGLLLVLSNLSIIHAAIKYDDPGTFSTVPIFSGCLPTDDFASDPYDNVKFYRCANGYQYSMRCAPGTIYYGNALCDYDRSQPEPAPNPDWNTSFNYSDATVHFIPPVVIENTDKNMTYWNINGNHNNNNNNNNNNGLNNGQEVINNQQAESTKSSSKMPIQLNNGEIRNNGNNDNNRNNFESYIDSDSSTTRMASTSTLLSSDLTTQKNLNSNLANSSVSRISTSSFMSSIRYTPSYIPTVSRSSVYYVTTKSNKISQSPVSLTSPFKSSSSSSLSFSSSSLSTPISSSTVSSTVSSENTSSPQSLARSSTSASSQLLQETKTPECKSEAEVLVKTNKPAVVPCQCSCVGATYPLTMVINNV